MRIPLLSGLLGLSLLIVGCGKSEPPKPWYRHMVARSLGTGQVLYEGDVDYTDFSWGFGEARWWDRNGQGHTAFWQSDRVGVEFHPIPESLTAAPTETP